MILTLAFFVSFVNVEAVSLSDSILCISLRNENIFHRIPLLIYNKKLYDSVLQNEHIKLLADHYNVHQDSFVLIFYLSFMQLQVSIKNHKLKPGIIKNQEILNMSKNSCNKQVKFIRCI